MFEHQFEHWPERCFAAPLRGRAPFPPAVTSTPTAGGTVAGPRRVVGKLLATVRWSAAGQAPGAPFGRWAEDGREGVRMRRYDDPVDVRTGIVDGVEAPAQFVWCDRLWQVRAVVAHWVETAPWWDQPAVQGLLGVHDEPSEEGGPDPAAAPVAIGSVASLVAERDVWRVDASRGRIGSRGILELVRDGASGQWRLTGCED